MFRLPINDVIPGMVLGQDIYGDSRMGIPILCAGVEIKAAFLYMLKKRGVEFLYTSKPISISENAGDNKSDFKKRNYVLAGLNIPVEKSKSVITLKTKNDAIQTMKDFQISLSGLDADDVHEVMNVLDNVLNRVLSDFPKNLTQAINVHPLRGDDNLSYVYRHALSVAVISMAIGQYLSLPREDVLYLGKCASLHDIGMFLVPSEILQKKDPLKRDELEKIKRHTQLGYRRLVEMEIIDTPLLECIMFHHERIDGTGYPLGLKGEDIPLRCRIISVADVYDAMTSARPHRPALTPAETCEYIMGSTNVAFEYDIVAALLKRIEFYPVGICVKLSSGEYAVVTDNTRSKLRPTIRIVSTDTEIDLNDRRYMDITILRAISYQDIIERK